jgi:predicted O-linked N-acetylglucosamine transferase (SPINDLY family)
VNPAREFERLRALALAGRLREAREGLADLHRVVARDASAAAMLAWIANREGDDAACAHWLAEVHAREPGHTAARSIEIELALRQGRAGDAVRVAMALVADDARSAWAQHTLGVARVAAGEPEGASGAFDAALSLDPRYFPAWIARGALRFDHGDHAAAIADFTAAIALDPAAYEPRLRLATVHLRLGDGPAALPILARLVAEHPDDPQSWRGLAEAEELAGRVEPAIAARERALALDPGNPAQHLQQALMLARFGLVDEARAAAALAAARAPAALLPQWLEWQMLPLLYRDAADMAAWRERWREGLARFEAVDLEPPAVAAQIPELLATVPNFLLHYQGDILREEQQRYGALVTRWVARVWPPRAPPPPRTPGRLRVAFASAHLRQHTVGKLFRGWIEGLDRARFEVWGLHLGLHQDAESRRLAAGVEHWIAGLSTNEAWVEALAAARLDAIVYLDIGMDGLTQVLAAQRLAPLQCVAWGHPVTTGMRTIDCFLSSAAMEPAGGAAHYTERLVRLPGLGIRYALPERARGFQRAARDPAHAPLLLCAQSVFKFLPLHYDLYARIAEQVPKARFGFIPHPVAAVRAQLAQGFRAAFARRGQDFDARATLHPYQDEAAFFARLAEADVLLDTIGWSGGNTTLEALAMDLPVVTCAGATMRSRHTHGMLAMMGLAAELSAASLDAYVETVARLASDTLHHRVVVAAIARSKHVLYDAADAVPALEAVLIEGAGRR